MGGWGLEPPSLPLPLPLLRACEVHQIIFIQIIHIHNALTMIIFIINVIIIIMYY